MERTTPPPEVADAPQVVRRSRRAHDQQAVALVQYLRAVVEPILDPPHRARLTLEHQSTSWAEVFILDGDEDWKGLIVGKRGCNIDAVRALAAAWAKAQRWAVQVEVRVAGR